MDVLKIFPCKIYEEMLIYYTPCYNIMFDLFNDITMIVSHAYRGESCWHISISMYATIKDTLSYQCVTFPE